MIFPNTPTSYVVEAASNSWYSYVAALHDHVANTSSQWNVVQYDDDGANYGVTLTPTDASESFHVNYRNDASAGDLKMTVDPNGSITSPNAPDTSGDVAPEDPKAGTPNGPSNSHRQILVLEWPNAIAMITKNHDQKHLREWAVGGRVYEPIFANDPDRNLDGLGWYGCIPRNLNNNWSETENNNASGYFRTPDGWKHGQARSASINTTYTAWNTRLPSTFMLDELGNSHRTIGVPKFAFIYDIQLGSQGLRKLRATPDDGWLVFSHDGGDHSLMLPWDPSLNPA